MLINKDDRAYLNLFATDTGGEALEYLAKRLYEYYAHEAVIADGNEILRHQGAARLAEWIKKLPQGLRNHGDANPS